MSCAQRPYGWKNSSTLDLATELTIAWLSNPNTRNSADDVPAFLRSMHEAVAKLGVPGVLDALVEPQQEYAPAVTVRKSLASKDHILSMIDGKPYRALRRHLTANGLTPEEYRVRYNLKADYPMVAESYSEARRATARSLGLGRKAGQKIENAGETASRKAKRSGKAALAAARKALGPAK